MGSANTTAFKSGQFIHLCDNGASYAKIEAQTGVKICTAQRLYEHHFITRSKTYTHPPGRPKLHSRSARSRIFAEVDTNRHTAFKAVAGHHNCSTTTIRQIAATGGLH